MTGTRQMFHARLPAVKGTAGGVAFLLDEVMPASPAYCWTVNHTVRLDDPLELFPTFIHRSRGVIFVRACPSSVVPGRGRSPRTRKPCTGAVFNSLGPVFMVSGPAPSGNLGMTCLRPDC